MKDQYISWLAPSHEHREHTGDWYWAVGIIIVALAVAFFITGNILFSFILIIGGGMIFYHQKHPPTFLEHEISRKGIRVGDVLYTWDTLEAFWIQEEQETRSGLIGAKLLLVSQKQFMPQIVVPLDNAPLEDVRHLLSRMLHEVHQKEPITNRIARMLGL